MSADRKAQNSSNQSIRRITVAAHLFGRELEKQNLKVLSRCRDVKLAVAKHKSRPVRGQPVQEESVGEKVMRGIRTWQDLGAPMPPHP
jgi:hypothetical protein